jgi:peptidoglycan/xylan/chitin deacetylase (PgdA/CDA1 family)
MNSRTGTVLMYHRVGAARNDWEARYAIGAETFRAHMDVLSKAGHNAFPVAALCASLEGGPPLPEGAFVLTFDDGFRGVREHALPVLEKRRWPFTVFLVSGLIGGRDVWTRSSNPDGRTYPLLDADEIKDMQRRGVSFHSHTRSHASLPTLDDRELERELVESRAALGNLLGQDVAYLAYPFGHLDDRVVAATRRAGYRAAFSTQPGFNRRDVDRFRIRRIDVYGTDTPAMLLRKMRFGTNDGRASTLLRYYAGRVRARIFTAAR